MAKIVMVSVIVLVAAAVASAGDCFRFSNCLDCVDAEEGCFFLGKMYQQSFTVWCTEAEEAVKGGFDMMARNHHTCVKYFSIITVGFPLRENMASKTHIPPSPSPASIEIRGTFDPKKKFPIYYSIPIEPTTTTPRPTSIPTTPTTTSIPTTTTTTATTSTTTTATTTTTVPPASSAVTSPPPTTTPVETDLQDTSITAFGAINASLGTSSSIALVSGRIPTNVHIHGNSTNFNISLNENEKNVLFIFNIGSSTKIAEEEDAHPSAAAATSQAANEEAIPVSAYLILALLILFVSAIAVAYLLDLP